MSLLGNRTAESRFKLLPYLLGVVVIAVVILKFVPDLFVPDPPPLIPRAEGLVMAESIDELEQAARRPVARPQVQEEITIAALGLYTKQSAGFQEQTTIIVLARDGWRFAEIVERPKANLDAVVTSYGLATSRTVTMAPGITATWLTLDTAVPICLEGRKGSPGTCIINRVIVFQNETGIVTVSSDPRGATDGELLTLAKSMAVK